MTESEQEIVARRGLLAGIIFYIVCILLFPAMVIGYVFWVGKLYAKRNSGVSGTAQGPLSARWFQHRLGIRYDETAHRLLMALPGISPLAVWLLFGPLQLAHRLSGYVPPAFRYPFEGDVRFGNQVSARQTFYDRVVDQYLDDIAQLVILGAGFDTDKPSLFLWEGVTPYLDRIAVEDTLRKIAGCARGSVIAFDYFTTEVLESQSLHLRLVRASLRAATQLPLYELSAGSQTPMPMVTVAQHAHRD